MNNEVIKVYDQNLNNIALIEDYKSFQCTEKFADVGSFTIKLAFDKKYDNSLIIMNFIKYKNFDGVITGIQKTTAENGTTEMIVSGASLNFLLSMRVNVDLPYFNKSISAIVTALVTYNCIDSSDWNGKRVIPHLTIGGVTNINDTLTAYGVQYGTLLDNIKKLANEYNFGFNITLDAENKILIFNTFKTYKTVKIGSNTDNILTRDYTKSVATQKNVAFMDSLDNIKESHIINTLQSPNFDGLNRFETFVDGVIERQSDETEAAYNVRVNNSGAATIIKEVEAYDVTIDPNTTEELEVGYAVSIDDREYNLNITTTVTEKQITVENGTESFNYILGNDVITKRG